MRGSRRSPPTVGQFLDAGRDGLRVQLVEGRPGLDRVIREPTVNRPGLALTGFMDYFAHRRIQVLGHAENAYLASISRAERQMRLRRLFEEAIPCVVVTRNRRVLPEILKLSAAAGIPVLRSPMVTMDFVNAATLVLENWMVPRARVQGTMVEVFGVGMFITGKSGVGKSETALALVQRGHSLVSDDVTDVRRDGTGALIGAPVAVTRYHMEVRGLGIIHVPSLFGVGAVRDEKKVELVVNLVQRDAETFSGQWGKGSPRRILGVAVPEVKIPVVAGRDLANLLEAAALDFKLRLLGHDAAKELDEKLISALSGGGVK